MIILKRGEDSEENIRNVVQEIERAGLKSSIVRGELNTTVSILGDESKNGELFTILSSYPGVERAIPVQPNSGYKIVSRLNFDEYKNNLNTAKFMIGNVEIGNGKPVIIAGPCAVQTEEQTLEIADSVREAGANMLRGGAYKPRTSPYDFPGLEEKGLEILAKAREKTGLPIVTEVMDPRLVELVGSYADMLQIGARSMQNYPLLKEVGKYAAKNGKAVLLKTSLMPSLKDVLCSAEYIACEGAHNIVLCERGMSVTTTDTRNTPNFVFLMELRESTYLPVIGDPSHSTGKKRLVAITADSYLAAGANGLIIEVRRDNEKPRINGMAVCDYNQSLPVAEFRQYMDSLRMKNII